MVGVQVAAGLELKNLGGGGRHRNKGHVCWGKSLEPWCGPCGPGEHMEGEKWRREDAALESLAGEGWEVRAGSEEVAKTDHRVTCTHTRAHSDAERDLETSKVPVIPSSDG